MKENEILEELERLKKLHEDKFINDEKLLERLAEIEKKRKENLKESISKQKADNLNLMISSFSLSDIETLIKNSMI